MMTPEEDMNASALRAQGWTISAIARHLERDRKTIRAYLAGDRQPGVRRPVGPDPFDDVADYIGQRLTDDPHVLATALFDEARALGYPRAYATFTRQIRDRRLRPVCPACTSGRGVPTIEIEHAAGEETQWDWVELPGAPWLDGGTAMLLVGSLAYSSKTRGVFCDEVDQPHTFDGIDGTVARLGGVTRRWRFDRMATVVSIGESDRVLASFTAFAKHYGVMVDVCPARRPKRKGVVEKNIDFVTRRWWRTADVTTAEEAQRSFDIFCQTIGDARPRHDLDGRPSTVAALAEHERLRRIPATRFPATLEVTRKVAANATISYRGNHYSVDPALVGVQVLVRATVGTGQIDIVDLATGLFARHRLVAPGQGAIVRDGAHAVALEAAVLAAFTTDRPCTRKANRPPSPRAKELAAAIRGDDGRPGDAVVIDLASWAALAPEAGR